MPIPRKTRKINRTFMRDEVYNTLLRWIMEGVLRPGEKLVDTELAEYIGVSRTPVREAIKRLEDKSLVETAANKWTKVADISIEEAELIYPIIWTLEELSISMALPQLSAKHFKAMEQANAKLEKAIKERDPVKASKADADFHDVYIKKSGNFYLIDILQDLKIKHRRMEVFYFEACFSAADSVREHDKIMDAMRSGDLEKTLSMVRANWVASLGRLRSTPRDNKDLSEN